MIGLKYGLVLSDYDDTLTLADGTITPRTVAAVKAYRAAGGIFVVCTGRSYASVRKLLPKIYGESDPDVPAICFQGGTVAYRGKTLRRIGMKKDDILRLTAELEARGVICQLYSGDRMFCSKMTVESHKYEITTDCRFEIVGDPMEFIRRYDGDFDKLLMIAEPARIQSLLAEFAARGDYPDCKFVFSRPIYLEAIPRASGKDGALRFVADYLGVPVSQTAAFGDSNNDTDMLRAAGFGVAMGNAREECKLAADYVAEPNTDDGLAKTLESFICR